MIDVVAELHEQARVQRQPDGSPTYLSDLAERAAAEIMQLRGKVRPAIINRANAVSGLEYNAK